MKAVALIPAYNEAGMIREVVSGSRPHVDQVIVVDDGSTDDTVALIADLGVVVVRHEANRGKADTLWTGFAKALELGAEAIVTLDGDGQHGPPDIPRLLAVAARYPERIVIGTRLHDRANFPPARYRANRFAGFWISWAAGYPISDTQSGFRVYPASLLRRIDRKDFRGNRFVLESEMLIRAARLGVTSIATPIPGIYPKAARASHFRPVADIAKIVVMVAGQLFWRAGFIPGLVRSLRKPEVVD